MAAVSSSENGIAEIFSQTGIRSAAMTQVRPQVRAQSDRRAEEPSRRGRGRRRRGAHPQTARGRQADRPRARRAAARRRLVRRGRRPRHPPLHRLRHGAPEGPGRRRGLRLRHGRRPAGLRLRPGLHRLRRLALRDQRPEDLQGHGPGGRERRAGDRPQRLRRRPHPGGGRLARRLRRHLPAQHPVLGSRAADQRHPGPLRRRRGLLAGDHRLHLSWSRGPATCSSPAPRSSRP